MTGPSVLLAVVKGLYIAGQVVGVTVGKAVGFVGPVHCCGVELLCRVLLSEDPSFVQQPIIPRHG